MTRLFCIALCLILVPISLYAQNTTPNQKIKLAGDEIDFDRNKNILNASGNVEIYYKRYTAYSDKMHYDIQKNTVTFPNYLEIKGKNYELKTGPFTYNGKKYKGKTSKLDGRIGRLLISGDHVKISPETIHIKNAHFTTCETDVQPRYDFYTSDLYMYPAFGFMVAFNNRLSTSVTPLPLWAPTFAYGSRSYSLLGSTLPSIGSNNREGFFIKQRFGYFVDRFNNGSWGIGTSEKLGLYLGVNHNQILDVEHSMQYEIAHTNEDGFEGGLIFTKDFPKEQKVEDTDEIPLLSIFANPRDISNGQLTVQSTFRKIIQDSRVDHAPFVRLSLNRFPINESDWNYQYSIGGGHIRENTTANVDINDIQFQYKGTIDRTFPLGESWSFGNSLIHEAYINGDNEPWLRAYSESELGWRLPLLNPRILYRHVFTNEGQSPFDFQNFFAVTEDEVGFRTLTDLGLIDFGVIADYPTKTMRPRNLDYFVSLKFNCWKITFILEPIEDRMRFDFTFF